MKEKYILVNDNKEYTFKEYTVTTFENQTSIQSLFNGSIFKDSKINNSNFSKSDFEGTIWINVFVNNSIFKSCDIKSSMFNDCTFINCDFSLSIINDTSFKNCRFEGCLFTEAIMSENTYNGCALNNIIMDSATITLSKFDNCNFKSSLLGNCSFYDHIMVNCHFEDVTINIDSIGRIYGLTMDELEKFKYIFLGTTLGFAPDIFFSQIDKIFANKEWRIQKTVYLFNINKLNSYDFIISIFKDIVFYIENNIIVKHDELIFVLNILKQLKAEEHLPLFALYQGMELLDSGMELLSNNEYYNKIEKFYEFNNGCFMIFNDLLLKLSEENPNYLSLNSEKTHYVLEIHYDSDTVINFDEIINSFLKYNGYDKSYYSKLLNIKKGSIIEIISVTLIAVFALQLLLYGINGILLQFADMSTKIQLIKNKKYQKNLLKNSIDGKQVQPEIMKSTFGLLKNKDFNKTLSSLANTLDTTKIISSTLNNTSETNNSN
jgi:uncharacterized protein YjbI with pentapeptide repeats